MGITKDEYIERVIELKSCKLKTSPRSYSHVSLTRDSSKPLLKINKK